MKKSLLFACFTSLPCLALAQQPAITPTQPTPIDRALQTTLNEEFNSLVIARAQLAAAQDQIETLQKQLEAKNSPPLTAK